MADVAMETGISDNPSQKSLEQYFSRLGAIALDVVNSLRHCTKGVQSGKLMKDPLAPTFKYFCSAPGWKCVVVAAGNYEKWLRMMDRDSDGILSVKLYLSMKKHMDTFCQLWILVYSLYNFAIRSHSPRTLC